MGYLTKILKHGIFHWGITEDFKVDAKNFKVPYKDTENYQSPTSSFVSVKYSMFHSHILILRSYVTNILR